MAVLIASGNLFAQTAQQPALPRSTVSLTLPTQGTSICPTLTTGSNCIRNVPTGSATSLQSAINAATCGDTIVLAAGSTYSGNFKIPSTSCANNSGWIEVVSSKLSNLPSSGNRVGPADLSNMAIISTPNASTAIQFLPESNHWRLIGLEITTPYDGNFSLVSIGLLSDDSTGISVQAQLPSWIIFDRIYIHGLPTTNTKRGIQMDGADIGIVDSYCDEIHNNGQDSQCFASWNGTGPYLIQNNFIEAGAENIMFGGADPSIANLVPSDITIIGNLIQKKLAWRGETTPYNWVIKNLLEFKNGQRALIDGNVFEYTWNAAQPTAINFKSTNQSGGCNWCVVQDIAFTHNRIAHVSNGIVVSASNVESGGTAVPTQRILIQNNVLTDVSDTNWGSQSDVGGAGRAVQVLTDNLHTSHDIIFDHNTGFDDHYIVQMGDSGTVSNFQVTNDLIEYGGYGILGSGSASGTPTLSLYASGYIYSANAFPDPNNYHAGQTYPSGTKFPSSIASVGFTSVSGTSPNLSGNFQLTGSSPYYHAGTDGKDIGVWDWTCLNNESAAALAGTFVPSVGCASSGALPPQPPTNLIVTVR